MANFPQIHPALREQIYGLREVVQVATGGSGGWQVVATRACQKFTDTPAYADTIICRALHLPSDVIDPWEVPVYFQSFRPDRPPDFTWPGGKPPNDVVIKAVGDALAEYNIEDPHSLRRLLDATRSGLPWLPPEPVAQPPTQTSAVQTPSQVPSTGTSTASQVQRAAKSRVPVVLIPTAAATTTEPICPRAAVAPESRTEQVSLIGASRDPVASTLPSRASSSKCDPGVGSNSPDQKPLTSGAVRTVYLAQEKSSTAQIALQSSRHDLALSGSSGQVAVRALQDVLSQPPKTLLKRTKKRKVVLEDE